MEFRLLFEPTLEQALRTAVVRQLQVADGELGGRSVRPQQIHEARKAIKRVRAWLRLMEPVLGAPLGAIERTAAEAARHLAAHRERDVLRATLDSLVVEPDVQQRRRLSALLGRLAPRSTLSSRSVVDSRALLAEVGSAIDGIVLEDIGVAELESGLRASYAAMRQSGRRASARKSAKRLHAWRKRLRWFTEQSRLLTPLWPTRGGAQAEHLLQLKSWLGRHHDLADLAERLDGIDAPGPLAEELRALIIVEQADLAERSLALGPAVFASKAKCWRP